MFGNKKQIHNFFFFNINSITIVTFNIIIVIVLIFVIYSLIFFIYSKSNKEGGKVYNVFLLAFSFEIRGKGS